jgi:predicted transport protein
VGSNRQLRLFPWKRRNTAPPKQYIGYFRGKRSFVTTEIQKGRILVYLSLTKTSAQPWVDPVMRDVSKIGHFDMGNVEYSLGNIDQLDEVRKFISLAYTGKK